jgi:hypothetical protein
MRSQNRVVLIPWKQHTLSPRRTLGFITSKVINVNSGKVFGR